MHIPVLISDLAVMLITAGLITILFKKIKQPLVLGYILAGFLISSYFPFFPTVVDTDSITTWSEIGIIFLMFHLGLEFNLHKLAREGSTAIITAIVEVIGILAVGFLAGRLLGFGVMDSVFLGGMLSMSSTTIIIKAFDELQLRGKKFTELVFGTLVIEDIVGIYFVNQIVEYIVHNGLMKDLSVLQESPFTDRGSVAEVFTDMEIWSGIRKVIDKINANATVA